MLTEEVRRKIRRIEIATGKLVDEVFAGKYESLFKGRGVEFAEVREYQPGDDVRSIDWNLTARFGKPFLKKLDEERELTVMLCVDISGSLDFGSASVSKREMASEIAAILAFSALRNNDKVGLMLFTDRVEKYIPARKGRRHSLRLIREILDPMPHAGRGTDLSVALRYLNRVQKRRAVVFLISDFLGQSAHIPVSSGAPGRAIFGRNGQSPLPPEQPDPLRASALSALRLTQQRHDLSAFRLYDPREEEIPAMGRVRLRDLETGESLLLDTSSKDFQRRYGAAAKRRREESRRLLASAGADFAEFSTADSIVTGLVRFFAQKAARRRRARRAA